MSLFVIISILVVIASFGYYLYRVFYDILTYLKLKGRIK